MQAREFSTDPGRSYRRYEFFTENGMLRGLCRSGELDGKLYLRDERGGIDKAVFREAINSVIKNDASMMRGLMSSIIRDEVFRPIAEEEIKKMIRVLEAAIIN